MTSQSKKKILYALGLVAMFLVFGTFLYHFLESWNWVDSFYFTAVTLTTIGYGDLAPTHSISKILTSIFSLLSIPVIVYCFSVIAEGYVEKRFKHLLAHETEREVKEIEKIEKKL